MQLEEILSAAVAAVDVNEIELDSIPSPSVELPLKNTQLNNYTNNNNNNNIDNVVKGDDDRKFMTDLTSAKNEINMGLQYSESYAKYNTDIPNDKNSDSCDSNNHSDEDEMKQERGLDMPILIPLNEDEPEKQNDFETDFKNDKRNKILNKSDLNENMQHPVEVSFFDLGDENLVITSEQALEMFESIEANANNTGLVPLTENREHTVRNIGFDRYQSCDNFDNYYLNIPNNGQVNYINHNALPVDLNLEVPPPPCSIEEVVGFASEVEVESTSEIPSNSTSNIEAIHQFNSDTPEYTMLTAPMEYNSVSSVVSGALRTISDGTPFDTPSCSSVDSSLEAENQFVVRVSAPGIDLAIPNHELSNYFSNTNNGNYSDTNDMDFLNAFNLSDENEIFKELCNDNTKHENNFECDKSREEIVHETNEKEVKLKSLKRKRDHSESGKREEPPQKVPKNHNSVMAALRESIFRSKARKIVNQLGKEDHENTTLNEKSNDKPPRKHIKKKDENSKAKDFNSNMKNFGSRKYVDQNDPNRAHSHCHNIGQNSRNSQNIQTPERNSEKSSYNLNEINSPASDNQKHEYKSSHDNTNRKRTFENDSPSRENFYKGENNIRREKQRTSSCSSCKCKCSSSNNEPYMMIRPEDLPSILKKNCNGETSPIVMLQPDALKDTDGEQLKVQLVYLVRSLNEKRMSRESSSHSPTHHHSIKASSPKCDNSCSSCYNPSPSSSTSKCSQSSQTASSSKDSKWTGKQKSSNSRTQFERYEKSPSTSVSQSDKIEDPEAYLRKPIVEWSYADVIFFLMDACKELHINPGDVKFKRSDNGSVLLQMTPNDFEVLAPNHGQRLYDYFVNFQTQHYMSTNSRNIPHRYNGNYSEDQGNYSRQENVHTSHHQSYTSNNLYPHPYDPPEAHSNSSGHYDQYPSSPCHSSFPGESPANEYIPQGSQYSEHNHSSQSSEEMRQRKSYELPSAAWKIFPPLHNYEDPLSDPDEFEDEPPPAEPPKKRGPGRPPKPESERKRRPKKTGRLWEFIRNLLLDPKTCPSLLRWEDAHAGIFRIVQSDAIANKWGMRKNNEKMNYEKLSRAMRYYYKAKIFEPVLGKRLVYKFGINAKGWRPLNPNNPNFQNY